MDWMVIIGHRSFKSTFGANKKKSEGTASPKYQSPGETNGKIMFFSKYSVLSALQDDLLDEKSDFNIFSASRHCVILETYLSLLVCFFRNL